MKFKHSLTAAALAVGTATAYAAPVQDVYVKQDGRWLIESRKSNFMFSQTGESPTAACTCPKRCK